MLAAMGVFNKSITVTSNGSNGTQVLYIKGTVVEKPKLLKPLIRRSKKPNRHGLTLIKADS